MHIFDVLISKSRFPIPIVISDFKLRFPIQADVACFRFRHPIPIRDFAISRFRDFSRIRDLVIPRIRDSAIARFRNFANPRFRDSGISRFRDFAIPEFRDSTISRLRNSAISRFHPVSGKVLHRNCRVNIPDVPFSKRIGSAAPRLPRQHHVGSMSPLYAQRGVPLGPRAHPFDQ